MEDEDLDEGYPTPAALEKIKAWPYTDTAGLLQFLYSIWWNAEWCWHQNGRKLFISTAGWSGNEDLIAAMRQTFFWTFCWQEHRRGGHYTFEVREALVEDMPEIC